MSFAHHYTLISSLNQSETPTANAGDIILVQAKLAPYLLYSAKIWVRLHLPAYAGSITFEA